jgi:uncharacterized protein (UPF0264 family)
MSSVLKRNVLKPSPCDPRAVQLLVSVRSRLEAVLAIDGGAQVLDVKEPDNGSLGMASLPTLQQIAEFLRDDQRCQIPMSVALGECRDWIDCTDLPTLPREVTYAKLGLSHLSGVPDWQRDWQQVRDRFDQARGTPLEWVAVAYADAGPSESPPIEQILTMAVASGCSGLLIDTYAKTGRTLTDFVSTQTLTDISCRCRESRIFLALAGSLSIDRLPLLSDIPADIIAIRSAACRSANRRDAIDAGKVAEFKSAIAACQFASSSSTSSGEHG